MKPYPSKEGDIYYDTSTGPWTEYGFWRGRWRRVLGTMGGVPIVEGQEGEYNIMSDKIEFPARLRGVERVRTDREEVRVFLSFELFEMNQESTLRGMLEGNSSPANEQSRRVLWISNRPPVMLEEHGLSDVPDDVLLKELYTRMMGPGHVSERAGDP